MTDDEILALIERRMAEVEDRLPPRELDLVGGVRPVRRRPVTGRLGGGASIGLAAFAAVAVIAVGLVGVGVVGRIGGATPGTAQGSAGAPSPSLPSTPSATPPYETSFVDGLEVLRGEWDAQELISLRLGWSSVGRCMVATDVLTRGPDLRAIDAAAVAAGIDEGWLNLPGSGRVFIGPSVQRAAIALGAPILAFGGRGDTAIFLDGAARGFGGLQTPAGRTAWLTRGMTRPTECPPGVNDTPAPVGPTPTIDPADQRIEVRLDDFRRAWNVGEPSLPIGTFEIVDTGADDSFSYQFNQGLFIHGQVWPDDTIRVVFVSSEPGIIGTNEVDEIRLTEAKRAMAALIRAAAPAMTNPELDGVLVELGIDTLTVGAATQRTVRTHDLAIFLHGTGQPDWSLRIQDADDAEP